MELRDSRGLTEAEAIARYKEKNYPKPALTADMVVFCRAGETLRLLLVERGGHPFLGKLALPGGFAAADESIEETALRELAEETGVDGLPVQLVGVYSRPGRDPRGWVVSAAFAAVVSEELMAHAGDDAADARWYELAGEKDALQIRSGASWLPVDELAFDHGQIVRDAMEICGL